MPDRLSTFRTILTPAGVAGSGSARLCLLGLLLALSPLASVGCASEPAQERPVRTSDGYEARTASALLHSPRIQGEVDRLALDAILAREGRDEAAVLGYDTPMVETYFLRVDDRQGIWSYGYGRGGHFDDYERRAISTRSFLRYR